MGHKKNPSLIVLQKLAKARRASDGVAGVMPDRIRSKLREARFFLDSFKRDLDRIIRENPEAIEYYVSAFLNAMYSAHDWLKKSKPDPLSQLSKDGSDHVWRMRKRRDAEALQRPRGPLPHREPWGPPRGRRAPEW